MTIIQTLPQKKGIVKIIIAVMTLNILLSMVFLYFEYDAFLALKQMDTEKLIATEESGILQSIYMIKKQWEADKAAFEKEQASTIKENVENAYNTIALLDAKYGDQYTKEQRIQLVTDALRHQTYFTDDSGYIFITGTNGIFYLNEQSQNLEGLNGLDPEVVGQERAEAVAGVLEVGANRQSDYYSYYFSKPNAVGFNHKKLAYLMYYKPFEVVVGSGLYYEDIYNAFDQVFIEKIDQMDLSEQESYCVLMDFNRKIIYHPESNYIGKRLDEVIRIDESSFNQMVSSLYENNKPLVNSFAWADAQGRLINDKMAIDSLGDNGLLLMYVKPTTAVANKSAFVLSENFIHWVIELFVQLVLFTLFSIVLYRQLIKLQHQIEKQFSDEEQFVRHMIDQSTEAIILMDSKGIILGINKVGMVLLGKNQDLLLGKDFNYENKWGILLDAFQSPPNNEIIYKNEENTLFLNFRLSKISKSAPKRFEYILLIQNTTELEKTKLELASIKYYDTFLNCYNRQSVMALGQKKLNTAQFKAYFGLIDIDHFHELNNLHGQSQMDHYLKQFTKVIKEAIGPKDQLGRVASDQLLIVFNTTNMTECSTKMERIQKFLDNEMQKGWVATLNYSVVLYGANNKEMQRMDDVFNQIHQLMEMSKKNGNSQIVIKE